MSWSDIFLVINIVFFIQKKLKPTTRMYLKK